MGLLDKLFGRKTEAPRGQTITYRTGPDDTCRSLAKRFYGDESQWEKIYNANRRIIQDEVQSGTDRLLPGTELTIPDAKFDASGQPIGA
jgi:nucleoid-associated protein YgaU